MKILSFCIYLLIISLFLDSCSPGTDHNQEGEVVEQMDDSKVLAYIKYAKHFTVSYHKDYKVVKTNTVLRNANGKEAEPIEDVMVLLPKGVQAPALAGELKNASIIRVPVSSVAINLESTESFLDELGLLESIVAVGGLISYNDSIREKAKSGTIGQIGYSWHSPPNIEVLLQRNPDVFFMLLSNLNYAASLEKCRTLGIPVATDFSWAENHYLAKAEWIKYYALFFNEEEKAAQIFDKIEEKVNLLKDKVATLEKRPTAIWGYYTGNDRWLVHRNSVEAQFLEDAGLVNLFGDSLAPIRNMGEPISTEQLMKEGKEVDHWITGDSHSYTMPSEEIMSVFKAWRENNIYHNMKRIKYEANAYDWYSSARVRPDLVLQDLISLCHPELLPEAETVYMGKLSKDFKFPLPERGL